MALPLNPLSLESNAWAQAQLEDYLDQVFASLVPAVPYEPRRQMREEMRVHLEALVAAHCEMDSSLETAVAAALTQFGTPQTVSHACRQEWVQRHPIAADRRERRLALGAFTLLPLLGGLLLYYGPIAAIYPTNFAAPLLAGLLTGGLSRGRAVRLALRTQGAIYTLLTLLTLLTCGGKTAPGIGIILFLGWLPLGCLGTWFGQWFKVYRPGHLLHR